ncbi:MAG TPA: alkaline phosphatase D family protein [Blastocatellia bacterium]|nr:alkaline phosphatase D family protein [Blastocatellia bacterium]
MAVITVGPVIGKVTDTTARILIEVNEDAQITSALTGPGASQVSQTRSFRKNRPGVFSFGGLQPATQYAVGFTGAENNPAGRVKTLAANLSELNVAAVSCNFTPMRGETDLWADMRDRYINPGSIDVLLHIGDQIYADRAFYEGLQILNDGRPRGDKTLEDDIAELFRALYRMTWRDPATRDVLAGVSNLMIWDDHEIRDDWGSNATDYDRSSDQFYVGTIARRVYREYQRQLWDDLDTDQDAASGHEDHLHVWGSIGILFVDQRGGRSFARGRERPYLGTEQWERIAGALAEGGALSSVRALIVVTSVPLVFLSSSISAAGRINRDGLDDLRDHWAFGPNRKEQLEMIRALRRWKKRGKGERELLVLGGDVHVGGYTDIKHQEKVVFKQLITSAITNQPPRWYEFLGLLTLLEVQEGLSESYRFEHRDFTNDRNYGVILVRVPESGTPRIDGTLVRAV